MMNALSYMLHLENGNRIKLLTTILIKGNLNAKKKLMYMDVNAENTRVTRIIADNERIIHISIFGSKYDLCQWLCPFDRKKWKLGPSLCWTMLKHVKLLTCLIHSLIFV